MSFNRTGYFAEIRSKAPQNSVIVFKDGDMIGQFQVIQDGNVICVLDDNQLSASTPERVADVVFGNNAVQEVYPESVEKKAGPTPSGMADDTQTTKRRGRPRKKPQDVVDNPVPPLIVTNDG